MTPLRLRPYIWLAGLLARVLNIRKEILWVVVGQFLMLMGGLLSVKILTNVLPPAQYGELALGLSIAGVINLMLFGPMGQVALRFYSIVTERGLFAEYLYLFKRAYLNAVIVVIVLAFPATFMTYSYFDFTWATVVVFSFTYAVLSGLLVSSLCLFSAVRDRKSGALFQSADTWARMFLAVLLVMYFSPKGGWALAGYAIATFSILILLIPTLQKQFNLEIEKSGEINLLSLKELRGEMLAYGTPFLGFALVGMVVLHGDRWVLQSSLGPREVGIYVALYQIANAPVSLLVGVINQIVVPIIYKQFGAACNVVEKRRGESLIQYATVFTGVVLLCVVVVVYYFGEWLVITLSSSEIAAHSTTLWILVAGLSVYNMAQMMYLKGFSLGRSKVYRWPPVIYAVVFIISGYFLVNIAGVSGMAAAILLSATIYYFCMLIVNYKLQ